MSDIGPQRATPKSLASLKAELNVTAFLNGPDVGKWKVMKYSEEHKEEMQKTIDNAMKILKNASGSLV